MALNQITNLAILNYMKKLPELYQENTFPFWDDEYISEKMLQAHLDPATDAASRKPDFIKKSVSFITDLVGGGTGKQLLDLGCGPGIYTQLLKDEGFEVTGIDFSKRSIAYAKDQAQKSGKQITYLYQDYLSLNAENMYDVILLIYCDFGVLSPKDREHLLSLIQKALKPGGVFLFDAWSQSYLDSYQEKETINYSESDFWSPKPHVIMERNHIFKETKNTLEQYLIITEDEVRDYYIWNQIFSVTELTGLMRTAGFRGFEGFDDVAGAEYTDVQPTICIVGRKP